MTCITSSSVCKHVSVETAGRDGCVFTQRTRRDTCHQKKRPFMIFLLLYTFNFFLQYFFSFYREVTSFFHQVTSFLPINDVIWLSIWSIYHIWYYADTEKENDSMVIRNFQYGAPYFDGWIWKSKVVGI